MNTKKSIISTLLTLLLSLNMFVSCFVTNIYGETDNHTYNGTFLIDSLFSSARHEYEINYDDAWFKDNYSYIYNHKISNFLMKASLACTEGWGYGDDTGITDLFDKLGYSYINNVRYNETNDSKDSIVFVDSRPENYHYDDPTKDGIGYGIAHKIVNYGNDTYTYIGIDIRGAGYEMEWGSNFTVGDKGDHYGFEQAASRIEDRLLNYINEINLSYPTRIWITGYSRGGATANILGHYLNLDALEGKLGDVNPENIFTYTFEAPQGKANTSTSKEYTYNNHTVNVDSNIFNVISAVDLIPKVLMKEMGFSRYGVTKTYPSSITTPNYYNSEQYLKFKEKYKAILNYDSVTADKAYYVDDYVYQLSNQASFFNCLSYALSSIFYDDRTEYEDAEKSNAQQLIRMLFDVIYGDKEITNIKLDYVYKKKTYSISFDPRNDLDFDNISVKEIDLILDLIKVVKPILEYMESINSYNITIDVADEGTGKNKASTKAKITGEQFLKVYNYLPKDIKSVIDEIREMSDDLFFEVEIAINAKKIVEKINKVADNYEDLINKLGDIIPYAHYLETNLAWNEIGDEVFVFKNARYNKIKVGSNADIKVFYKDDLVGEVNKNTNNLKPEGQLEAYLEGKGENSNRVILVPDDKDYKIEIIAKNKDTLKVETHNINAEDCVIRKFDVNISSGTYELLLSKTSETLNGSQVSNVEKYEDPTDVVLGINYNKTRGNASGAGKYSLYDYAKISVNENEGYSFSCWTDEHNNVVSDKKEFNYLIKGEEDLFANIIPIDYSITYDLDGGKINGTNPNLYNIETETFVLINPSKEDCVFVGWTGTDLLEPTKELTVQKGSIGNKTYKANWINIEDFSKYEKLYKQTDGHIGLWTSDIKPQKYTGKAITPSIRVYDDSKLLKQNIDYTIKYSNNTKIGTASITITGKGNYKDSNVLTFDITRKQTELNDIPDVYLTYTGKDLSVPAPKVIFNTTTLKNKTDYTYVIKDESNNEYTKVKEIGKYTVTVSPSQSSNYSFDPYSYNIYVQDVSTYKISQAKIGKLQSSYTCTGSPIEQDIVLTHTINKIPYTLVEDEDYKVYYDNNTNIGTATITIVGIGNYYGSITKTFKINGLPINKATVALSPTMDYTGSPIRQDDVALYYQGNKLEIDVDYTVSYDKNINKGTASVTYTGIGKYSGTLKKSFKINPIDINKATITLNPSYTYMKGGVKPTPTVTYNGNTLLLNTDYTLSYKNNTKLGIGTVTVKGKGNYSGTSIAKEFVINHASIANATISIPDKVVSTKKGAWKSTPTLVDIDGKKLAAKKDYNVEGYYYNEDCKDEIKEEVLPVNTVVYVKVEGVGSYNKKAVESYRIVSIDISKASIGKIDAQPYTGKPVTLNGDQLIVTCNKKVLESGKDFVIDVDSYTNNINKGNATVTIKGIGDFGGSKTIKFAIGQKSMKDSFIESINEIFEAIQSLFE